MVQWLGPRLLFLGRRAPAQAQQFEVAGLSCSMRSLHRAGIDLCVLHLSTDPAVTELRALFPQMQNLFVDS